MYAQLLELHWIFIPHEKMYEVHKKVAEISTENGFNWEKQCFRLPVVKIIEKDGTEMSNKKKRKKRAVVDESVESFIDFDENTDW